MAIKKGDAANQAESTVKTPPIKPFSRLGDDWHLDLRRQLLRRIGVAALLIFTLLGGLALYDSLNSPAEFDDEEDLRDPRATRAVEPTKPIKPAPADPATNQTTPSVPLDKATPSDAATMTPAASATTAASAPPTTPSTPASPPAPSITKRPGGSADVPAASPSIPQRSTPGDTPATEPTVTSQRPATVSTPPPPEIAAKPVLPAVPTAEAPRAAASPPKVDLPPRSGYLLQSSALSDAARAEELQARLAQVGIPSVIETRLQVGPFRSRADAESARRQMNALGVDGTVQRIRSGSR